MAKEKKLHVIPDGWLDEIWEGLVQVNEDSSRDEMWAAIDEVTDKFNELDPERFPLEVDGEVVEADL